MAITNEPKYVTEPILTYYDTKIKEYIDEKSIKPQVELERRLDAVEKSVDVNTANIASHREELDDIEARIINLERDDISIRESITNIQADIDVKLDDNLEATKKYVDGVTLELENKIEESINSIELPDTSQFVTKYEVSEMLEELPTKEDISQLNEIVVDVQGQLEDKADKNDLIGLATEEFVRAKIAEAELNDKDVDLSEYYTKTEVDALIPDVSNFATKQELEDAISNVEHPTVDLTGYATEKYVDDAIAAIPEPDLSDYAKKTDIPSVEGLATEKFVSDKIAEIVIPEVPTKISELENDTGYITSEDIPEAELFVVDYNAPNFEVALEAYNNGKLLLLTNAAPDGNGYAVMNYVREDLITFTKFLMSRSETYGAFNTYYLHSDNTWELAKEVKLNKVDAIVDDNNDITGLTIGKNTYEFDNFATTEVVNQINKNIENIENTYVSTDILEAKEYITTSEATTKIEQIVKEEVAEAVTPDAINYDTWE